MNTTNKGFIKSSHQRAIANTSQSQPSRAAVILRPSVSSSSTIESSHRLQQWFRPSRTDRVSRIAVRSIDIPRCGRRKMPRKSSSNLHNSAAGSQQVAADAGAEDVETVVLFEEWLRRTLIPPATGSFPWSRLPRFGSKRAVSRGVSGCDTVKETLIGSQRAV